MKSKISCSRHLLKSVTAYTDFFMKALAIKYHKQQDDEEKLKMLNVAYRGAIEPRVKMENSLIKLEPPV